MGVLSFKFKKTTELTDGEIDRLIEMFIEVFEHPRTREIFFNQFLNTQLGYSFHTLMYIDGELVGADTTLPAYFIVNGERLLFVTGADTMITKKHRDIFNYIDMLNFEKKELKKAGIVANYGYPNDLNYKILMKGKLTKEIGHMYTYCLPYRVGGVKRGLSFLNWLSEAFCWTWLGVSKVFASSKVSRFAIEKDLKSYNECRYKRNDGVYNIQEGFVYKVMDYEGVRAGFLIDVFEKSPKNFCKAVNYMLKHDGKNFDILLYPGFLPFAVTGMIKIPHGFEPKHFHMTGGTYNKEVIKNDLLLDINNWDTNLSNYDII